jgi:hypothetical protein
MELLGSGGTSYCRRINQECNVPTEANQAGCGYGRKFVQTSEMHAPDTEEDGVPMQCAL